MIDSAEHDTPPKSTKSKNSRFLVQIQIKPKSQIDIVSRDTEESEFLDLVDLGGCCISVESVIACSIDLIFDF